MILLYSVRHFSLVSLPIAIFFFSLFFFAWEILYFCSHILLLICLCVFYISPYTSLYSASWSAAGLFSSWRKYLDISLGIFLSICSSSLLASLHHCVVNKWRSLYAFFAFFLFLLCTKNIIYIFTLTNKIEYLNQFLCLVFFVCV